MIDKRLTWIRKASNEVTYIMVVDVGIAFVHSSLSRYPYRLILSFINLFRTLVLRWRGVGVITMEQCVWLLTGTSSALLKMQRCSLLHIPSFLISHNPNCLLFDKYSIASKSQILFTTCNFQSLAECMGGELLARVCEVFSKGFAHSRGGLPDLTLWSPAELSYKVSQAFF